MYGLSDAVSYDYHSSARDQNHKTIDLKSLIQEYLRNAN